MQAYLIHVIEAETVVLACHFVHVTRKQCKSEPCQKVKQPKDTKRLDWNNQSASGLGTVQYVQDMGFQ